eukprot:1558998-Amphidinium_carterae.2
MKAKGQGSFFKKNPHWDLSPGPSSCESDVIPLHHVPTRPVECFYGIEADVIPLHDVPTRLVECFSGVFVIWGCEIKKTGNGNCTLRMYFGFTALGKMSLFNMSALICTSNVETVVGM